MVQLYLTQPGAGVTAPLRKLVGFRRIAVQPGQTLRVSFQVPERLLAQFTDAGEPVVRTGEYRLAAGGCCPIPRSKEMGAAAWSEVVFQIR